jgi:hypothetical protein
MFPTTLQTDPITLGKIVQRGELVIVPESGAGIQLAPGSALKEIVPIPEPPTLPSVRD